MTYLLKNLLLALYILALVGCGEVNLDGKIYTLKEGRFMTILKFDSETVTTYSCGETSRNGPWRAMNRGSQPYNVKDNEIFIGSTVCELKNDNKILIKKATNYKLTEESELPPSITEKLK